MEIISTNLEQKNAVVMITDQDIKALNATVKLYQDKHKDHVEDNISNRLKDIEDKLHSVFRDLNP